MVFPPSLSEWYILFSIRHHPLLDIGFDDENSIHPKGYDIFTFKPFEVTLLKIQIYSFIVIINIFCLYSKQIRTMFQSL